MAQPTRRCKVAWAAQHSTLRHRVVGGKEKVGLEEWLRMFRPNWESIACDLQLGRTELRVLLLCTATADTRQRIPYTQREMAAKLGVTAPVVNRAVRILVEKGLVFQEGQRLSLNSRLATDTKTTEEVIILRKGEAKQLRALGVLGEEEPS